MRILHVGILPLALATLGCSFEPQYNAATESEAAEVASGKTTSPPGGAAKPRKVRADPNKPPKPVAGTQLPGKRTGNLLDGGQ
jgi:hypothetical protein